VLQIPADILTAEVAADTDPGCPEPLWDPPTHPEPTKPAEADAAAAALQVRHQRAAAGLRAGWTLHATAPDTWQIITQPEHPGYTIHRTPTGWHCTCPDFAQNNLGACKHTLAVALQLETACEPVTRNT